MNTIEKRDPECRSDDAMFQEAIELARSLSVTEGPQAVVVTPSGLPVVARLADASDYGRAVRVCTDGRVSVN